MPALSPYVLIFECLIAIVFVVCLWDARRRGGFALTELLWTGLYGFLLEWLTLKQLHAYHYGQFLILIDGAPLSVALGWGVVIYAAMRFSNRLQMEESLRPLLDVLLALNVDLAFDTIAIRLGMWTWNGVALDQQWFGVPWANFWAWFVIVWSYSTFLRAFRPWRADRLGRWLYTPLAMLLSLLMLWAANLIYPMMTETKNFAAASIFLLVGSLFLVLTAQPRLIRGEPPEPLISAVPLIFHAFTLLVGAASGIFAQNPLLALVGVVLLIISLIIHLPLLWTRRTTHSAS